MKKLLFTILMILPFVGIGQTIILNDDLIEEKFPNQIGVALDVDGLTSDEPNYSGPSTFEICYFEGIEFESNGVFIEYYLGETESDENYSLDSPKTIRFASYNSANGDYSYPTVITYYRNGKIKEIDY
jgi:hypothetical protein